MSEKIKIALGADHAGFALKEGVRDYLASKGCDVEDFGTNSPESVDYPDYAEKVARRVAAEEVDFGVLFCGTGLGVAIAANKVPGIRAATCNASRKSPPSRKNTSRRIPLDPSPQLALPPAP